MRDQCTFFFFLVLFFLLDATLQSRSTLTRASGLCRTGSGSCKWSITPADVDTIVISFIYMRTLKNVFMIPFRNSFIVF
jgi:hypothetical protein